MKGIMRSQECPWVLESREPAETILGFTPILT
jgi:hypothetical protein